MPIDMWEQVLVQIVGTGNATFEQWWCEFYGLASEYSDPDEYYTRKAFAYFGWLAFLHPTITETDELLRSQYGR